MIKALPDKSFSWLNTAQAIWYFLAGQRRRYVLFTILLLSVQFLQLLPTFLIGKLIDFFTHYTQGSSLYYFYVLLLILGTSQAAISLIRLTAKNRLSDIQSFARYTARVKGFERLMDLSIAWHDKENTGNKVQRIEAGTSAMQQLQRLFNTDLSSDVTVVIGVLIAFLFFGPVYFIFGLIYIGVFLVIQSRFFKRMVTMNTEYLQFMEKASGTYYEGLSNLLTIKTLGVKNDFKKSVGAREKTAQEFSVKLRQIGFNKWKSFQIFNAFSLVLFLFLVGRGYLDGAVTIGSIVIFYSYYAKLSDSVGNVTSQIDDLINGKTSIARMMPIYWDPILSRVGTKHFPKEWSTLSFNNAIFHYIHSDSGEKNSDAALSNLNFEIKRTEKIGVVGRSGSGKSTLAKVFLGLYEIQNGDFKVGTTDFYDIQHDEVTQHMALVLQDSEMFNLTLQENITLLRPLDPTLLAKAIEVSQLSDLIDRLPQGIETLIGEKGYRLSGGERQRIGLARAIYKDPDILILDESTSSLDSKTESLIQESLEKLLVDKTVITIAHRVSTLKNTDRIIVFEKGGIVEDGSYQSLTSDKNSYFSQISHQQQK